MNDKQAQRREVSIAILYTRRALASRIDTTRRRTIIYDRSSEEQGYGFQGFQKRTTLVWSGLAWRLRTGRVYAVAVGTPGD